LVGKENVKLSKKQIDEIIDLMSKEDIIELEEQIEKALEKGNQETEGTLKEKQSGKEEKEAIKATVIAQGDRKKADDPSSEKSAASSNLTAMSAAPPTHPPSVTDPVDEKDNSKTL
jgi:LETM1 and EF-hand domain-containing protein 1